MFNQIGMMSIPLCLLGFVKFMVLSVKLLPLMHLNGMELWNG